MRHSMVEKSRTVALNGNATKRPYGAAEQHCASTNAVRSVQTMDMNTFIILLMHSLWLERNAKFSENMSSSVSRVVYRI